jgi:hypothetical protein
MGTRGQTGYQPHPSTFPSGRPRGRPPKTAVATAVPPAKAGAADSVASWRKAVDKLQQAAIDENAKAHGMSPAAYRAAVDANLQARLQGMQIYTRRSVSSLASILKSGTFQTFRESGRSAGVLSPARRNGAEAKMFGKAATPIYGYMSKDVGKNERAVGFVYGPVAIRLKSAAVGGRTTVSFVDSLNALGNSPQNAVAPSPLSAPTTRSWSFGTHGDPLTTNPAFNYYLHAETQIQGGVRASDIAEVTFQRGSRPTPALAAALQAQGIPYSIAAGPRQKLYSSIKGPQHLPIT